MTASNHFVTGALIAVAVRQPVLAVPLAFASHFALDALPHFGFAGQSGIGQGLRRRASLTVIWFDVVSWLLLMYFFIGQPWWLWAAALAAVSPDIAWAYRFIFKEKWGKLAPGPTNSFNRFHQKIQKYERPWGIFIEIAWFILFLSLLTRIL